MFVDTKSMFGFYADLDRRLKPVEEFLNNCDFDALETGRFDLKDGIFYIVSNAEKKGTARFEAHRKYIDVQYVISGSERIVWRPIEKLTVCEPYNSERDILFYTDDGVQNINVDLYPERFVVLYPQDAHAPENPITGGFTKKIVFKIPV